MKFWLPLALFFLLPVPGLIDVLWKMSRPGRRNEH